MNKHESTPQNTTSSEVNQQTLDERRKRAAGLLGPRVTEVMAQLTQDVDAVVEFHKDLGLTYGTPIREAV